MRASTTCWTIGPPQLLGGGAGELALADTGLAAHQQRSGRGQRGLNGTDLIGLEAVPGTGMVAGRGQGDDGVEVQIA